jgi:polysaccharide pyruvyl transferase CsaB
MALRRARSEGVSRSGNPSARKRIILLGWYGSDNTGDEAVLQAVVDALQERGFTDLHVLSTNPTKTAARLGLSSTPRSFFSLASLRALRGADAIVLGGGGLIQDGTSVYNMPMYAGWVAVARLFGLQVIGWGLGVEPLHTLLGRLLARFICTQADYFSVRDALSKRLLMRAGVPAEHIKITADPAFLIVSSEKGAIGHQAERPSVIFCLRSLSDNHPGINLHYLLPVSVRKRLGLGWQPPAERVGRLVDGLARAILICTQEFGARVMLLPLWPGRDDAMIGAVEQAAMQMGVTERSIEKVDAPINPHKVAALVGRADLLVSMRLHALIFAATQGVPSLALSYARKMRGQMRLLGAERWVVEVERRTPPPEEIEMKLKLLWAMRAEESERLKSAAMLARQRAESDADAIAVLLLGTE